MTSLLIVGGVLAVAAFSYLLFRSKASKTSPLPPPQPGATSQGGQGSNSQKS